MDDVVDVRFVSDAVDNGEIVERSEFGWDGWLDDEPIFDSRPLTLFVESFASEKWDV